MKIKLSKQLKKRLLSFLSIADYFRAKKNTIAYYKKNYPSVFGKNITLYEQGIDSLFVFGNTKQGHQYWRDVEQKQNPGNWFTRLIKKIIVALPFLLLVLITGCKKELPPEPKIQKVYYEIQCGDCLVYLQDEKWNDGNEITENRSQHFNVQGKFKYVFENNTLDSVKMTVYVSVFTGKQQIYAVAYTNDGHRVDASGLYGFDNTETYPNKKTVTLKLR